MLLIFLILLISPISYANTKEKVHLDLVYKTDSVEVNHDSLYTVKKGETLYSIAKHKETSVALLKTWNKLTSSQIQAGQTLLVVNPQKEERVSGEEFSNLPKPLLEDSVHVVVKGECISGIAAKYNLEVKSIAEWNKLTSPDRIYPGQALKLYPVETVLIDSLKVISLVLNSLDSLDNKELAVPNSEKTDTTTAVVSSEKNVQEDTAVNGNLFYDFNPGGVKTLLNVLVLVLLLIVFIYNIHK